jgi:CRISPR-associated protein Cas2
MIWSQVRDAIDEGDAVIAWTAVNEAGFDFDTCGRNRRVPVDLDGFKLVSFLKEADFPKSGFGSNKGPSNGT